MRRLTVYLGLAVALSSLVLLGCSQAAPAAAPTAAPKAAEPTKAAAPAPVQPTAVPAAAPTKAPEPAKTVDFPTKGKTIQFIVSFAAGGGTDVGSRILAASMEPVLGVPVQVVNKPGAGSQTGITELAQSKPDGYTIGVMTLPNVPLIYLDADRKAAFGRKDLQPIANHVVDVGAIAVKADSPYKSVKDLVDAAKAKPGQIKLSTTGVLGPHHIAILQLQKLAGVEFAIVHFDGSAPAVTAALGGHIDAVVGFGADLLPQVKSGELRILGVMDSQESKFMPGVKTFESQGYKIYFNASRLIAMPAGAPKEVVNALSTAIKKAMDSDDHKKRIDDLGVAPRYMDPDQVATYWTEVETQVKPLLDEAKASQTQK